MPWRHCCRARPSAWMLPTPMPPRLPATSARRLRQWVWNITACCAPPAGSVVLQTAARAAAYLAGKPGNILLATGAKELPAFAPLDPARLYPRVLPTLAGITACETAGIPHRNIIAMQGPFTRELNVAVMHQFHIAYMVTKDGGAAGGFAEKAQAAAQCGVQLIVLRRPEEQGETAETILQRCRELL